jgi:hypothetical protein
VRGRASAGPIPPCGDRARARSEATNDARAQGALSSRECSQGHPNRVRTAAGRGDQSSASVLFDADAANSSNRRARRLSSHLCASRPALSYRHPSWPPRPGRLEAGSSNLNEDQVSRPCLSRPAGPLSAKAGHGRDSAPRSRCADIEPQVRLAPGGDLVPTEYESLHHRGKQPRRIGRLQCTRVVKVLAPWRGQRNVPGRNVRHHLLRPARPDQH